MITVDPPTSLSLKSFLNSKRKKKKSEGMCLGCQESIDKVLPFLFSVSDS